MISFVSKRFCSNICDVFSVYKPPGQTNWHILDKTRDQIDTKNWPPVRAKVLLPNGNIKEVDVFQSKVVGFIKIEDFNNNK